MENDLKRNHDNIAYAGKEHEISFAKFFIERSSPRRPRKNNSKTRSCFTIYAPPQTYKHIIQIEQDNRLSN